MNDNLSSSLQPRCAGLEDEHAQKRAAYDTEKESIISKARKDRAVHISMHAMRVYIIMCQHLSFSMAYRFEES